MLSEPSIDPAKVGGDSEATAARVSPRRRRKRRIFHSVFWPLLAVVLLTIGAACVALSSEASSAKRNLEAAQQTLTDFKTAAAAKQFTKLPPLAAQLERQSDAAAAASGNWLWNTASDLPALGVNLQAVSAIATSVQQVAHEVVTPAASILGNFTLARDPATGAFDTTSVREVRGLLATTERVLGDVKSRLATVGTTTTISQVSEGVANVRALVDDAAGQVPGLRNTVELIAELIGANGPRAVVLAFLNNAEAAPLGGGPAAQALLSVADGNVKITKQVSSSDFHNGDPVTAAVSSDQLALYDSLLLMHVNASMSIPDFPTSAGVLRAWWTRDLGVDPDVVITLDPIGLSRLLQVTGPVALADGTKISADNVVIETLNRVYFRYPKGGPASDAFFASIANAVFTRLTDVDYDLWKMADALAKAANSGNLLIWSKDPTVQAQLAKLSAAGIMPTANTTATSVGVYFRDRSASKIDTYLHTSAKITTNACKPETPVFTVEVALRFEIPAGLKLPTYVDSGIYDFYRTEVYLYGPVGALATDKQGVAVARSISTAEAHDLGRPVVRFITDQNNGDEVIVRATFTGTPGAYGPTTARVTPMINATEVKYETATCG